MGELSRNNDALRLSYCSFILFFFVFDECVFEKEVCFKRKRKWKWFWKEEEKRREKGYEERERRKGVSLVFFVF